MDIDYMEKWRDWTYDPVNFPVEEVQSFVDLLHSNDMKFVPIVDPGILAVDPSWDLEYAAYSDGMARDLFVRDGFTGAPYMSQVWPGPTLFPDWFHPNASAYWGGSLQTFWDAVPFDGIWVDMNEAANFCNDGGKGQVCSNANPASCPTGDIDTQTTCCLACSTVDAANPLDFPPYAIGNDNSGQALGHKTLPPSALHYDAATAQWAVREYDVHNLFGLMEARLTADAVAAVRGKRPFVLSRSTFAGHGAHAAHWSGDNAATWEDLRASVVTVLNMNLFGIPMVGSDICGFIDDTTEELCGRWMALGAFTPFSRNHNIRGAIPQEPYRWESVAAVSRAALGLRYRLLPYLYSLLEAAHETGALVAQPLWAPFAADPATHAVDEQFLLGDSLLVSPALYPGQTTVQAYFPAGPDAAGGAGGSAVWFPLAGGGRVACPAGGSWAALATPAGSFNVHVRSGRVLPLHAAKAEDGQPVLTTAAARRTPYELLVAFDYLAAPNGTAAEGSLFLDDGEQIKLAANLRVRYTAALTQAPGGGGSVVGSVEEDGYAAAATLGAVVVLGLTSPPSAASLTVDGASPVAVPFAFDAAALSARFDLGPLGLRLNSPFGLSWTF
jgi:alpha-glucosidase (family GH31 glycosyl hydrolase)